MGSDLKHLGNDFLILWTITIQVQRSWPCWQSHSRQYLWRVEREVGKLGLRQLVKGWPNVFMDADFLQAASNFLFCGVADVPFKFLGLAIGVNPRGCKTWQPVVDSFKKILASWKGKGFFQRKNYSPKLCTFRICLYISYPSTRWQSAWLKG